LDDQRRIATVVRDKYYDPDGWKRCTLRSEIEIGRGLWLVCGTCQKSRYFKIPDWAREHGVNLDTPFKTLGKRIRCQRCGTRGGEHGVSAYGQRHSSFETQPRQRMRDDAICPRCGSDDVQKRRMLTTDYPAGCRPKFKGNGAMMVCGCYACDNWWTQPEGIKLKSK
jgi:hypothetical protein